MSVFQQPADPDRRPLKIVIPPRAGPGAQPAIPAAGGDQGRNIINRDLPCREVPPCGRELPIFRPCASSLRFGGRVPRKISNARFRDPIFKLRKGLDRIFSGRYSFLTQPPANHGCGGVTLDGFVKSPDAALRFILRHCGVRQSTPHSSEFARLACGLFTKPSHFFDF
jgi:hypothetical protein